MVKMDKKTFDGYFNEAKRELDNNGNNYNWVDVFNLALDNYQTKFEQIMDNKFERQKNNLYTEIDNTFFNLKKVVEEKINELSIIDNK
jgi:hypothetical protein